MNTRFLLRLCAAVLSLHLSSAVDFLFNGFRQSGDVTLYGNATISSRVLTLSNDTAQSIGRALYPTPIPTSDPATSLPLPFSTSLPLPFSTSFIFSMAPYADRLPGHGIVFLLAPRPGIQSSSAAQHLGLFNFTNDGDPTNRVFGVEFDVFENQEFGDINDNHVGIDVNSLTSVNASDAGYWPDAGGDFRRLRLNSGRNYQAWIDYIGGVVNVTMAPVGVRRPNRPLLSIPLNLSLIFGGEMYVGFTASTGALIEGHMILGWSFSNTNFTFSEGLITTDLPSFELPETPVFETRGFIAGLTSGVLFVVIVVSILSFLLITRYRRIQKRRSEMEDWELEYWPHKIPYREIESATNNFSEENVIGVGSNGKVYKGKLSTCSEVAVKRMPLEGGDGMRSFMAEISSLGRLRHRNLVGLRGWCKKEKGSLIMVYDYMENGSLDKRVFDCEGTEVLSFEDRVRILKQVASAIFYLHYGWESKVLHRDIKASNVLLDKEMNAMLGDFGLARMHDHDKAAGTTRVVGTVGYLAPEVVRNGRASTEIDVFGYGVLVLEVICGRRPIEDGKPPLVEWLWDLLNRGELITAIDERLRMGGEIDWVEIEKVLHLGLLCAHPDPKARPTMRNVVKQLEGLEGRSDESEGEDMNLCLLEKMKSREIWSMYPRIYHRGLNLNLHPTFDEVKEGLSNSIALSLSSSIVDGR